jgi:hypothetical protein
VLSDTRQGLGTTQFDQMIHIPKFRYIFITHFSNRWAPPFRLWRLFWCTGQLAGKQAHADNLQRAWRFAI